MYCFVFTDIYLCVYFFIHSCFKKQFVDCYRALKDILHIFIVWFVIQSMGQSAHTKGAEEFFVGT